MNAMKKPENFNEMGNSGKAVHHNQQIPGLILKVSVRLHDTSGLSKYREAISNCCWSLEIC